MTSSTEPAPEGWYPDPDLPDSVRFWDGSGWTEHVRSTVENTTDGAIAHADAAIEKAADAVEATRGRITSYSTAFSTRLNSSSADRTMSKPVPQFRAWWFIAAGALLVLFVAALLAAD